MLDTQEIFTYFEPGMVKTKKNKKGVNETTATYGYDDLYRLITKNFGSGVEITIEYDANGNRTKMVDLNGEKKYTFDDSNRMTKVVQGPIGFVENTDHNFKFDYTWNAASQLTQYVMTVRTLSAKTWGITYTDVGQINVITNPDSETFDHDYLTDGRLKKITLSTGQTRELFYQDTDSSHAYVANKNKHLRKTLDKKANSTVICSFEYELDAAGNRLSVTDKDGKYTAYGMDPTQQLKSDTKWSAKTPGTRELQRSYKYDPNGNRISEWFDGVQTKYTFGDNNELLTSDDGTTETGFNNDHFGNLWQAVTGTPTLIFSISYDNESHLLDVTDGTHDDYHTYDGDGRRMSSNLNGAANDTFFIHDEITGNVIGEYTLVSGTFTLTCVNTWGIGLLSTNRGGTKRYFHFDGLGSTAALTDSSEVVQDTYFFSAFGIQESSTGSSVNPFRFCGQWGYYDDGAMGSHFGFMLLGVRYYWPEYGRFMTWDPLPDDNLYRYCKNAPTQLIDPTGKRCAGWRSNGNCDATDHAECARRCAKKGMVYVGCDCIDIGPFYLRRCRCAGPTPQPIEVSKDWLVRHIQIILATLKTYQGCMTACQLICGQFVQDNATCDTLCKGVCSRYEH